MNGSDIADGKAKPFTVALIGPDGAGKTTVAVSLANRLAWPVEYLYMGINAEAANRALPTTRLVRAVKRGLGAKPDTGGPPDPRQSRRPKDANPIRRLVKCARAAIRVTNQLAEEGFRQWVARNHVHRGSIVVFDRDFYADYHAYDIVGGTDRAMARRVHGLVLSRFYRRPDLTLYLDAPGSVLFARKGEGSIEALERRRADYLDLAKVMPHFEVVDASRPLEDVVGEVVGRIEAFSAAARGGSGLQTR
jgi:thymidylate kinase